MPAFPAGDRDPGSALLEHLESVARETGEGRAVCVVARPDLCRSAVSRILGLPPEREGAVGQEPGAVDLLLHDPRREWLLEIVNDSGHIRRGLRTDG